MYMLTKVSRYRNKVKGGNVMKHVGKKNNLILFQKQFNRIAFIVISVVLLIIGVFLASGMDKVIAKYFKYDGSGEVINANSFYFTSNHLSPIAYDGTISEYVMGGWDGKSKKSFSFNIRNYDNPLLYNDKEQNVKYEMEYQILNGDEQYVDVKIYRIVNGVETEETEGILLGKDNTYAANEYKLSFISKDADITIDHDVTVLLKVKSVDAPYYAELYTKVTLQYTPFKNFISYQGVSTEEDKEKSVSIIYDINTANQIKGSEMENTDIALATENIHLMWNNDLLEFNEFDKKVKGAFNIRTLNDVMQEYDDMSKCKNTVIIDDNNIGHIFFDALAYSAYEIVFHKRIETSANAAVWKAADGAWLWELPPAPLDTGTLIYANVVERTTN